MRRCERPGLHRADDLPGARRVQVRPGGEDRQSEHRGGRRGRAAEDLPGRRAARAARVRTGRRSADRGRRGQVGGEIPGRGSTHAPAPRGSSCPERRVRARRTIRRGGTGSASLARHANDGWSRSAGRSTSGSRPSSNGLTRRTVATSRASDPQRVRAEAQAASRPLSGPMSGWPRGVRRVGYSAPGAGAGAAACGGLAVGAMR